MLRTVVLVVGNLVLAALLAINVVPVVLVVAPFLRSAPVVGYLLLIAATVAFALMNAAFFRAWKRRGSD